MDGLVVRVMSVMNGDLARGFPQLIAPLRAQAVSSYQITEVCLPVRLAGHCQLIIPPARHLHGNVPPLINAAELGTSPCLL